MKKYAIMAITFILLGMSVVSCNKGPLQVPNPSSSNENSVVGEWNLVQVYGGLAGTNELYELGEIVWTIDSVNASVTILNSATTTNNNTYFDSGTYSFQITGSGSSAHLKVNNEDMGTFTINGNELLIDQNVAADGLYYRFLR